MQCNSPVNCVSTIKKVTYFSIPFNIFGLVTVSLPLFSLAICFLTSIIYKLNEVNETVCGVANFIPTISAITSTSPQRYIWRICIALHCAPRLAVGVMYYNYYMALLSTNVKSQWRGVFPILVIINFLLYTVENLCLVGVTYISNKENYPLHEKIFIVFMVSSCVYMFTSLLVFRLCHPNGALTNHEQQSYRMKQLFFITIMSCTIGLLFYFYKHRVLCETNAFSWFAASEYGIAVSNMGFHLTAVLDFKGSVLTLLLPPPTSTTASRGIPNLKNGDKKSI